jgi:hypothetical protein
VRKIRRLQQCRRIEIYYALKNQFQPIQPSQKIQAMTIKTTQFTTIPASAIFDVIAYGRQDENLGEDLWRELEDGPWTFGDLDAALVNMEAFIDWLDILFGRDIAALTVDALQEQFGTDWVEMHINLEE